jgi:Fur family peroxide stress response transcriptional regulator
MNQMQKSGPYRHSRQRDRILELLQATQSHPTANWLFDSLRKEFPRLSMGTVYRNIGILVEQGRLKRMAFGSTFDRLDANVEQHYHFLCERCEAILDLDLPVDLGIDGWIDGNRGFVVHRHELRFHGLCPKCAVKA